MIVVMSNLIKIPIDSEYTLYVSRMSQKKMFKLINGCRYADCVLGITLNPRHYLLCLKLILIEYKYMCIIPSIHTRGYRREFVKKNEKKDPSTDVTK